jgi:hypothetical protein
MIPKTLEARNDVLFKKLVPDQGKCETLEGESLRALNRIIYRYYNDGDYWFDGYGIETAGSAEAFLREFAPIDLRPELNASDGAEKLNYEQPLAVALEKLATYIEGRTQYSPNWHDMLDCEPRYEQDEDY